MDAVNPTADLATDIGSLCQWLSSPKKRWFIFVTLIPVM